MGSKNDGNNKANKRIVKNSFYLYIRMLLTMAVSLYTSRLVLKALGIEDYGLYNVIGGLVTLVAVITNTMSNASQRFIAYEIGKGNYYRLNTTFTTIVNIHLLLAFIFLLIAETIGLWFLNTQLVVPNHRIFAAQFVFQCSIVTIIINLISVPYNALIISHEKMNIFAIISIAEALLKLGVAILITNDIKNDKLCVYALLLCLISLIIRILYGVYCKQKFEESKYRLSIKKDISKTILKYISWSIIGNIAGTGKEQGINILINVFFGVAINAARGISMQVYSAVNSFATNVIAAINPQITKSFASGDYKRAENLAISGSMISACLIHVIALPIIIETDFILHVWLEKVPDYTIIFVRLILILCFSRSLQNTLITLYLANGNIRNAQIIGGGIILLNLPISYLFLKLGYPAESTIVIGIILEYLSLLALLIIMKKTFSFDMLKYIKTVLLKLFIILPLSLSIPLLVFQQLDAGITRFISIVTVSICWTLVVYYIVGLNQTEKKYVVNLVKSHLHKS